MQLETSRRTFLALCAATIAASTFPSVLRLRAGTAYAIAAFTFTGAQKAVLRAMADTVIPGATVQTRLGPKTLPSAGQTGVDAYIENAVNGTFLYAAGVRRPPYVLPNAPIFPAAGAIDPLWTVKRTGWFGDPQARPTRPYSWPSALAHMQSVYVGGIAALDVAAGGSFTSLPAAGREALLRQLQAQEVAAYNGGGEVDQPFFMTFLDHTAQACFGDPVYGGNANSVYWDMMNFSGPSYVSGGGPGPNQGWTAKQMSDRFKRP